MGGGGVENQDNLKCDYETVRWWCMGNKTVAQVGAIQSTSKARQQLGQLVKGTVVQAAEH